MRKTTSEWSPIGHIRSLSIGLELTRNGGSCGAKRLVSFGKIPRFSLN